MKLHIHFGIHRTGTTSIIRTILNNLNTLNKYGYLIPKLGFEHRHIKIAWHLINKKINGLDLLKMINYVINEETKYILLISEDFSQLENNNWLKVLSDNFELSASLYLRRQDLWLESWYNQHIKWPWDKKLSSSSPSKFLSLKNNFYWLDYYWLLSTIQRYVNKEKIKVRIYENEIINDINLDFFDLIDINVNELNLNKTKENSSLTKCQLDIARKINLINKSTKERRKIIKCIKSLDITECDGSKTVFNKEQREKIIYEYDDINKNTAKNFFERKELFQEKIEYPIVKSLSDEVIFSKYLPELLK